MRTLYSLIESHETFYFFWVLGWREMSKAKFLVLQRPFTATYFKDVFQRA